MEKNKPIRTYKAGAVKASIFENKAEFNGRPTTTHRVAVDKIYKDSNGKWQSTSSFNASTELQKAILVLQKAYEFCVGLQETTNGNSNAISEEDIE